MLKIEGMTLHYGAAQILWGIDLAASAGQVTCVLGRNGVGKSSLLRGIVGHHPTSGGALTWEGRNLSEMRPGSPMFRRAGKFSRC